MRNDNQEMQKSPDDNEQEIQSAETGIEVVITGGDTDECAGGDIDERESVQFDERKHRAEIAGKLAFRFTCIFAAALAVHYFIFLVLALAGKTASIEQLSDYLQIWFPALTGVVSGAAAYYFAKAE